MRNVILLRANVLLCFILLAQFSICYSFTGSDPITDSDPYPDCPPPKFIYAKAVSDKIVKVGWHDVSAGQEDVSYVIRYKNVHDSRWIEIVAHHGNFVYIEKEVWEESKYLFEIAKICHVPASRLSFESEYVSTFLEMDETSRAILEVDCEDFNGGLVDITSQDIWEINYGGPDSLPSGYSYVITVTLHNGQENYLYSGSTNFYVLDFTKDFGGLIDPEDVASISVNIADSQNQDECTELIIFENDTSIWVNPNCGLPYEVPDVTNTSPLLSLSTGDFIYVGGLQPEILQRK